MIELWWSEEFQGALNWCLMMLTDVSFSDSFFVYFLLLIAFSFLIWNYTSKPDNIQRARSFINIKLRSKDFQIRYRYLYHTKHEDNYVTLRKLYFLFLSHWMGYGCGDSFPFGFEPNGIPFSSKSKGKRFWTKLNSIWFKIERKTVTTTISHSIWKEMEI